MKKKLIIAVALLIAGSGLALNVAHSQQAGIKRTDLLQHDLVAPGREVIQVRVDFAPGVGVPRTQPSGGRDRLRHRRCAGVSAGGQAAGDAQGRRVPFHPRRDGSLGEERRQQQRSRTRHIHRREGQTPGPDSENACRARDLCPASDGKSRDASELARPSMRKP